MFLLSFFFGGCSDGLLAVLSDPFLYVVYTYVGMGEHSALYVWGFLASWHCQKTCGKLLLGPVILTFSPYDCYVKNTGVTSAVRVVSVLPILFIFFCFSPSGFCIWLGSCCEFCSHPEYMHLGKWAWGIVVFWGLRVFVYVLSVGISLSISDWGASTYGYIFLVIDFARLIFRSSYSFWFRVVNSTWWEGNLWFPFAFIGFGGYFSDQNLRWRVLPGACRLGVFCVGGFRACTGFQWDAFSVLLLLLW